MKNTNDNYSIITVEEMKVKVLNNAFIIDTRGENEFVNGFIPGAIFLGLNDKFEEWLLNIVPNSEPLAIVCNEGEEKNVVERILQLGYKNIDGFLEGGFDAWRNSQQPIDLIIEIEPDELAMDLPFDEKLVLIDVRKEVEFADGHVKEAVNIPLLNMVDPANISSIEESDNVYLQSNHGYRSVVAASLLKRQGIHNIRNVAGGLSEVRKQQGIEIAKDAAALN